LASTVDPELCPFWTDGLCAAREERPIGCRTYFCDPEWQEVGARIHEDYHRRAQRMSEAAGFPYQYGPYVSLLRERASPEPDRR